MKLFEKNSYKFLPNQLQRFEINGFGVHLIRNSCYTFLVKNFGIVSFTVPIHVNVSRNMSCKFIDETQFNPFLFQMVNYVMSQRMKIFLMSSSENLSLSSLGLIFLGSFKPVNGFWFS